MIEGIKAYIGTLDPRGLLAGILGGFLCLFILTVTLAAWPEAEQQPLTIPNIVAIEMAEEEPALAALDAVPETAKILHLVITNIHSNTALIENILENFPAGISLGLSPYQDGLRSRISELRDRGRDVWVMLPSQSTDPILMQEDLGPDALHLSRSDPDNIRIATRLAANTHLSSGLLLAPDSILPTRPVAWRPVSSALKDIAVTLGDMSVHPVAGDIMNSEHYIKNTLVLDETPLRPAIQASFDRLTTLFDTQDRVIASISPYPISLKILSEWIAELDVAMPDVILRPLSDMVTLRSRAFEFLQTAPEEAETQP